MVKGIYIVGAGSVGGHLAMNIQSYVPGATIAGFFDDDAEKTGKELFGSPVLGTINTLAERKTDQLSVVIGIANPAMKQQVIGRLSRNEGLVFPTLIHDRAWISDGVDMGRGCIVYPNTSINYGSSIGDFVILNMNCALGHHTCVGEGSSLGPGVKTGGHTRIGRNVDLGIGAATAQSVSIGDRAIIGGQSMILHDVHAGDTMVGVPARKIN